MPCSRLNPGELAAYSIGRGPFFGYRGSRLHDKPNGPLGNYALGTGNMASMTAVHGQAGSSHQPHQRRQVTDSMSAQRMTLEPRKSLRSLRLAVGLIALVIPLSGCGTG